MSKRNPIHRLTLHFLLTVFVTMAASLSFAQDGILDVYGTVKDDETMKKMPSVNVKVKQNGSEFDQVTTAGNGKYEFELPLGHTYILEFSSGDFVTKKIEINTKGIPPEDMAGGFQLNMDMSLFAYIEGFDTSILDAPIGKASFDPQRNAVEFDYDYTARIQQMIQDEFDRLEKMADEMEKMLEEFNDLIDKGDRKMQEEKFADAVANFEKALEIFPDKEPAPEKLAAAQAALDAQNAAAELEARYNKLLENAKKAIKKEAFADAKTDLDEALTLKPDEREPKDLLAEIEDKLADLEKRKQYEDLVAQADNEFKSESWETAIAKYEEALALYSTEKYPREQITEAQRRLDDLNAAQMAAAELDKKYNDLITLGDKNLGNEEYQVALRNFQEAANLKKDERYPKDKIEEIEGIIADLAAQQERDAADAAANAEAERIDKEYQELIIAADGLFDGEQLEDARDKYQAALDLKSSEKYPRSRIARIDELIAERDASAEEDLLAEQRRQREEERLAAEEAERLDREARDAEKEAERQKRLEEEEAERRRLAEQKARLEEEERRRSEAFANNASSSTEDEADRYYREARQSEERAKTNKIQQKKDDYQKFLNDSEADSRNRREDALDDASDKSDKLIAIHRDGEMKRSNRVADKERAKQRNEDNLDDYEARADNRRGDSIEAVEEKEGYLEAVVNNDTFRKQRIDVSDRKQDRYDKNSEAFAAKGNALRSDNEYDVKRSKEFSRDKNIAGEQVRQGNIDDSEYEKEQYRKFQDDVRSAADERLIGYGEDTDEKKQQYRDVGEGKEVLIEDRIYQVDKSKEKRQYMLADLAEEARVKREETRTALFEKDRGEEKNFDDYYLPEGAEDLEEGVQERSYEEGNKMVIERTVKRGNKVDIYRKVISKTGKYYFKNGKSITVATWKRETLEATD